jgi:DNA-binding transcriptional regulator/RsmH inhibitor MraZ
MLLGEYRQAMDSMGQVVLPNQVLSELRGTLVVARGFERNLILYSEQQWRVQEWSQILQAVVEQDPNGEQWDGLGL